MIEKMTIKQLKYEEFDRLRLLDNLLNLIRCLKHFLILFFKFSLDSFELINTNNKCL